MLPVRGFSGAWGVAGGRLTDHRPSEDRPPEGRLTPKLRGRKTPNIEISYSANADAATSGGPPGPGSIRDAPPTSQRPRETKKRAIGVRKCSQALRTKMTAASRPIMGHMALIPPRARCVRGAARTPRRSARRPRDTSGVVPDLPRATFDLCRPGTRPYGRQRRAFSARKASRRIREVEV